MAQVKQPADKSHFILPDLGEGVHEAELIMGESRWAIKLPNTNPCGDGNGQSVGEVPSPWAGVVTNCVVLEGDIINVGSVLVYDGESSEAPASPAANKAEAPESPASEEREDAGTVVGSVNNDGDAPSALTRRRNEAEVVATEQVRALPPPQFAGSPNNLALTSTASLAPDAADA